MARLVAVVRRYGGWRERRARHYCGRTVWLGRRRSRLAVSRLVRWRLVAELLRPIRKALTEMAAGEGQRQLVALPQLNFPFVGTLTLPAVA